MAKNDSLKVEISALAKLYMKLSHCRMRIKRKYYIFAGLDRRTNEVE